MIDGNVGTTVTIGGVDYEVVWDGGEGLVAPRVTKVGDTWTAPSRIYNKTGKHKGKGKKVNTSEVIQYD